MTNGPKSRVPTSISWASRPGRADEGPREDGRSVIGPVGGPDNKRMKKKNVRWPGTSVVTANAGDLRTERERMSATGIIIVRDPFRGRRLSVRCPRKSRDWWVLRGFIGGTWKDVRESGTAQETNVWSPGGGHAEWTKRREK